MKFFKNFAMATALATGAATVAMVIPAQAAIAKEAKPKPSKEFTSAYQDAAKAFSKDDVATAKAAIPAMEAAATKDDDKYLLGKFLVGLGGKSQDQAMQLKGLEMASATSIIPQEEKAQFLYFVGKLSFGAKDYTRSIAALQEAKSLGSTAEDIGLIVALSNFEQGNTKAGLDALRGAIKAREATGQKADEAWFGRGVQAAGTLGNAEEVSWWARELVKNYPKATNWRASLSLYRDAVKLDAGENLDLMRLMRKAGAMEGERDYAEYADAAHPRRLPGEVISVIEEGRANGDLTGSSAYLTDLLSQAKAGEASDRAGLKASERDAKSGANGKIAMATADAFLGYEDYTKAVELYDVAITKGGIDTDAAYTRRGIAKLELSDIDGAKADFAKVGAGKRKPIADYWTLFVDLQNAPPPAAAPAEGAAAAPAEG